MTSSLAAMAMTYSTGDAGDDTVHSIDLVVNNDEIDGGSGSEIDGDECESDPDPEVNCEI